jgi:hypothetical protein
MISPTASRFTLRLGVGERVGVIVDVLEGVEVNNANGGVDVASTGKKGVRVG